MPPDFLWGTATAGVQVEGDLPASDWALFAGSPQICRRLRTIGRLFGMDFDPQPFGPAVRHFNTGPGGRLRFVHEDLDRAQALGLNAYRFSVEWSRVQPNNGDEFDREATTYYQDVTRAALARGMAPVVTLNHLSLPLWVLTPPQTGLLRTLVSPESDPAYRRRRGWVDASTVDRFLDFVRAVVPPLMEAGARIFITFNEPVGTLIGVGYIAGIFPPGLLLAGKAARRAYWHIVAAHCRAYDYIKQLPGGADTLVGIAPAILHVAPAWDARGRVTGRNRRAARQFDYFCNLHMLDVLILGERNRSLDYRHASQGRGQALQNGGKRSPRLDFIGVNYYRRVHVSHNPLVSLAARFFGGSISDDTRASRAAHGLLSERGWEVYPAGLYAQLRRLHRRYEAAFAVNGRRLRFCVTENGLGEAADANRAPYVVAHVEQMLAAMRDGVDVFGYLYWSLVDNWEWAENYRPSSRFGLFSVDRSTLEQPRCMTDAAITLAHLVAEGWVGQGRERFGAYRADGSAILGPRLSAGRLYAGRLTEQGAQRQEFELYLSPGADNALTGLLYYYPENQGHGGDMWVRLAGFNVGAGRLTFAHGPVGDRISEATYTIAAGPDPLFITGHATVAGVSLQVEAEMQPLGLYGAPAEGATKSDRRLWDGTWGVGGHPWALLIITRYQHNSGLSNARQLLDSWRHLACSPEGATVPVGGQITLALLPSAPDPPGTRPRPTIRQLVFTGRALANASGETIFARAPDGLELGGVG
jgi:beta-glucosidase